MVNLEDSMITYKKGIDMVNLWKKNGNKSELESAIQYFQKAIAAAKTESVPGNFPSAEHELELAEQELKKFLNAN